MHLKAGISLLRIQSVFGIFKSNKDIRNIRYRNNSSILESSYKSKY